MKTYVLVFEPDKLVNHALFMETLARIPEGHKSQLHHFGGKTALTYWPPPKDVTEEELLNGEITCFFDTEVIHLTS